jgi:DNA-binding CsgD family transcriptional regulator/nitrite reductase/ring-hydroxylating ferredoxin subunit
MRRRDPDELTDREREVLELLRRDFTNEQIAQRLGISVDGAKYHVSQILSKLGVATREDAAAVALGERRRWWAAWPLWARIAGLASLAATAAGLVVLAWGVLQTEGNENRVTGPTAVGPAEQFQVGQPSHSEDSEGHGFWVVRLAGEFVALSDRDTHSVFFTKECPIGWRTDVFPLRREGWFRGTCSGSNFDLDGRVVWGPSPASMYRYSIHVTGGRVFVDTTASSCSPLDASTEYCNLSQLSR